MKRVLLALAAASVALTAGACREATADGTTSVTAPTATETAGPPGPALHRLLDEVDLTADQRTAIEAVLAAHEDEFEALRAKRGECATRAERRDEHRALRAQVEAEIEKILTAEQTAQLKELRAERRAGGRRAAPTAEERAARLDRHLAMLTEELALTAEQQTRIRTLLETRHAKRAAEAADRPARPDRAARRAAHEAFLEQMKTILSATQYEQFEALRPRADGPRPGRPAHRGR